MGATAGEAGEGTNASARTAPRGAKMGAMETARETSILVGSTSPEGFEDAIRMAVAHATARLGEVEAVRVRDMTALIEAGNVAGYRVDAEVVFVPGDAPDPSRADLDPRLQPRASDPPPVRLDEGGAIRVGGTRVTLDSVLAAAREGDFSEEIAEEIVSRFPSLRLGDVRAVLAWARLQPARVDNYLARREDEAAELRGRVASLYGVEFRGLKERLLARRGRSG